MITTIEDAYPFDIAVYHSISVKVYQSLGGVHQLENLQVQESMEAESLTGDLQVQACLHSDVL